MNRSRTPVPIGLSVANFRGDARLIYEFIANAGSGCRAYELRPRGGICAAALDMYLLLSAFGSVASIASLLWMAYDRFIAPKRESGGDQAGIYIAIRRPDGTVIDLWMHGQSKEDFIREFELIIDEARTKTEFYIEYEQTIAELERSESWVRVDKGQ